MREVMGGSLVFGPVDAGVVEFVMIDDAGPEFGPIVEGLQGDGWWCGAEDGTEFGAIIEVHGSGSLDAGEDVVDGGGGLRCFDAADFEAGGAP
jgi:hypothetical protein